MFIISNPRHCRKQSYFALSASIDALLPTFVAFQFIRANELTYLHITKVKASLSPKRVGLFGVFLLCSTRLYFPRPKNVRGKIVAIQQK